MKSAISTYETSSSLPRVPKPPYQRRKSISSSARVDSSLTIAMLERMKQKVEEDEALAQAYGEIADVDTSVDAEINRALASGAQTASTQDKLRELKEKWDHPIAHWLEPSHVPQGPHTLHRLRPGLRARLFDAVVRATRHR
jgi:hypothetical protein